MRIKKNDVVFYNVDNVNKLLATNPEKAVRDAESNYRGQLFRLAKRIMSSNKNKIVLLAGPSCAGKTTSAVLLKEVLEKHKKHVITISMDDFFVDREKTPLLEDGSFDFDSLRALDLDQMEKCFTTLFKNKKAKFPRYDFVDGRNYDNVFNYELKNNSIILFEGLHVLNPELTSRLGTEQFFKVYANPETGFESDGVEISPQNLRLVRRMIRDVERRNHSPEHTMDMWKNVTDAEKKYIEPYKKDADFVINTTHSYELAIYKKELYHLLFNHDEVIRKLEFITVFDKMRNLSKRLIPDTSLMWEFVDKE